MHTHYDTRAVWLRPGKSTVKVWVGGETGLYADVLELVASQTEMRGQAFETMEVEMLRGREDTEHLGHGNANLFRDDLNHLVFALSSFVDNA